MKKVNQLWISKGILLFHCIWLEITTSDRSWARAVNNIFVYRTITCYNDTGSIAKRYEDGHHKSSTLRGMVQKVKRRLEQNPWLSASQTAELTKSDSSIRLIRKNNLKIKPCKIQGTVIDWTVSRLHLKPVAKTGNLLFKRHTDIDILYIYKKNKYNVHSRITAKKSGLKSDIFRKEVWSKVQSVKCYLKSHSEIVYFWLLQLFFFT